MWQASAEVSATTVALGWGEWDSFADFQRAYEVVSRRGESAYDLSVRRRAGGDVEVVYVDSDLAVYVAWYSVDDVIDGVQSPDTGPSGGGGAACYDSCERSYASADCAAERE